MAAGEGQVLPFVPNFSLREMSELLLMRELRKNLTCFVAQISFSRYRTMSQKMFREKYVAT